MTMFITLWILVWAIANGPIQILFLHWRYCGAASSAAGDSPPPTYTRGATMLWA